MQISWNSKDCGIELYSYHFIKRLLWTLSQDLKLALTDV